MGQRNSITANWTMDDWAYGTGEHAASVSDFCRALKELSELPFRAQAMRTGSSMSKEHCDLSSSDCALRRLFFRRKKQEPVNKLQALDESYFEEQENYFHEDSDFILGKDEKELPPIYAKVESQSHIDNYLMIL